MGGPSWTVPWEQLSRVGGRPGASVCTHVFAPQTLPFSPGSQPQGMETHSKDARPLRSRQHHLQRPRSGSPQASVHRREAKEEAPAHNGL